MSNSRGRLEDKGGVVGFRLMPMGLWCFDSWLLVVELEKGFASVAACGFSFSGDCSQGEQVGGI